MIFFKRKVVDTCLLIKIVGNKGMRKNLFLLKARKKNFKTLHTHKKIIWLLMLSLKFLEMAKCLLIYTGTQWATKKIAPWCENSLKNTFKSYSHQKKVAQTNQLRFFEAWFLSTCDTHFKISEKKLMKLK